jgi:translation initiation factor IF-2
LICLSLINRKEKRAKITPNKPGSASAAGAAKRINEKNCSKPSTPDLLEFLVHLILINYINVGGGFNANRPGFVRNRPAIVAKLNGGGREKIQRNFKVKGGKSKAAKYRRDKRDTHRQKSDDEQEL